jgi:hypothetical protein
MNPGPTGGQQIFLRIAGRHRPLTITPPVADPHPLLHPAVSHNHRPLPNNIHRLRSHSPCVPTEIIYPTVGLLVSREGNMSPSTGYALLWSKSRVIWRRWVMVSSVLNNHLIIVRYVVISTEAGTGVFWVPDRVRHDKSSMRLLVIKAGRQVSEGALHYSRDEARDGKSRCRPRLPGHLIYRHTPGSA